MKQKGFTLFEMLIAIIVFAAATTITALATSSASTVWELARQERADENNRLRANALIQYALQQNNYNLPNPYTAANYNSAIADPANTTITPFFAQQGLTPTMINTDESAAGNLAVYQMITINDSVSIFGTSGEQANITYQVGVIYQTDCSLHDATCNPNPVTGIPGDSPVFTTSNYQTWDVSGNDVRPHLFSTYIHHTEAVRATGEVLLTVRDALRAYHNAAKLASAPGATTNLYPIPGGAAPDLSGATAVSDEGCENGWYALNDPNVDVLAQIGLAPVSLYGQTTLGGSIEYCQDFDPGFAGANTSPDNAALRVNRNLSSSANPSSAGGNIILSM